MMPVDSSIKAWLSLSLIRGLRGEAARHLLKQFGSPEAVLAANATALKFFVKPEVAGAIVRGIGDSELSATLNWLAEENNYVVTLADSEYPQALLNISDPPLLIYVKGRLNLLNARAFAIVGSRHASPQGVSNATEFAKSLSNAGLCIVSGMAYGIDTAAHNGALQGMGSSIAVVGTGLDKVYPSANLELAHQLAGVGALISEFPLGTPPIGSNFPRRNRIISGMSMGCLIVEASLQSGSLITARQAMEQGRDVFAIPGSIHSPLSRGCHKLIKEGAKLVETAQDILEELAFSPEPVAQSTGEDGGILSQIGYDPVSIDTLCLRSGLTISELSAMLLTLELGGYIAKLPGGLFQRTH
jgi:DNA processing protein